MGEILWRPPDDVLTSSNIGRFATWAAETRGLSLGGYDDLWNWSVREAISRGCR